MKHLFKFSSYSLVVLSLFACIIIAGCTQKEKGAVISLSSTMVELVEGESHTLSAVITPEEHAGETVTWKSSDEEVAIVSSEGEILAKAPGKADISAAAAGTLSYCRVVVRERVDAEQIVLNKSELTLMRTEKFQMEAIVLPNNTTSPEVIWSSSNSEVATISESGEIEAVGIGDAVIEAVCGEMKARCLLTVEKLKAESISIDPNTLTLSKWEKVKFAVNVIPAGHDEGEIIWSTSDKYVAAVSQEGEVQGVAVGSVIVTATVGDVSATCEVKVEGDPEVGDFYYTDGTYSAELNPNKEPVAIVFWVGDPTKDDRVLQQEHPDCNHALAVNLRGPSVAYQANFNKYYKTVGQWIEKNTEYISTYTTLDESGLLDKMVGYGNTKGIEAFNAAAENAEWPVNTGLTLLDVRKNEPLPENTTGWYLPSIKELSLLCNYEYMPGVKNRDLINSKLEQIEEAERMNSTMYWSTIEVDSENALGVGFDTGGLFYSYKGNNSYKIRAVFAF